MMIGLIAFGGGALTLPARRARAIDWESFSWPPFEAAHAEAIPVVIAFQSESCVVCKGQRGLLDDVLSEPSFAMFLRFRVDFDRQRDVAEKLNVHEHGTVLAQICYEEIGRLVGDIEAKQLRRLLEKTQAA